MSAYVQRSSYLRALLLTLQAAALGACGSDGGTSKTVSEPHTWTEVQSMLNARTGHTATLLPDGKVLVTGGASATSSTSALASAELYDPSTGTWTETGSMSTPRVGHTATLLSNGDVLVVGGSTSQTQFQPTPVVEIYSSTSGTWSSTGSVTDAHVDHAAVLLPNGNILVAGTNYDVVADVYVASTGTWTSVSAPGSVAGANLMSMLQNGSVLAIFGYLPQLYDPAANVWLPTNAVPGTNADNGPIVSNLTSLKDGTFLIAGGVFNPGGTEDDPFSPVTTAFVYQPSTNTWSATGNMTVARGAASASLLQDGTVLVFGGTSDGSSELFDPVAGTWSATGTMVTARSTNGTATVLADGRVLVAGGIAVSGSPNALSSAEIYDP